VVDKKTGQIICTNCVNGKRHDFRVLKESRVHFGLNTKVLTDTGYQGLQKLHANTAMPKKKSKKNLFLVKIRSKIVSFQVSVF
jgi:hypothetical protein